MMAIGVRRVLIIGTKDIADPESAPDYVLSRTKPFPPHRNGGVAPSDSLIAGQPIGYVGLFTATSIWGCVVTPGAFPQVSRLAAAANY